MRQTMRLIDADELTEKCGEWYTEEGTEEGFIGTLKGLLDAAPTIPAIPVEWLQTFDLYYNGISGGTPFMNELVEAWKREQEAQNVRTQTAHD